MLMFCKQTGNQLVTSREGINAESSHSGGSFFRRKLRQPYMSNSAKYKNYFNN